MDLQKKKLLDKFDTNMEHHKWLSPLPQTHGRQRTPMMQDDGDSKSDQIAGLTNV